MERRQDVHPLRGLKDMSQRGREVHAHHGTAGPRPRSLGALARIRRSRGRASSVPLRHSLPSRQLLCSHSGQSRTCWWNRALSRLLPSNESALNSAFVVGVAVCSALGFLVGSSVSVTHEILAMIVAESA